jgi:hypothetical protein
MSRVAKKFRLLYRHGDGSAVFECNDAEGYGQLHIHADGSRSTYTVEGVCGDCMAGRHARADCPWRDVHGGVEHGRHGVDQAQDGDDHQSDDRVVGVVDAPVAGVPVADTIAPAEPAPDPVSEKLDRDAQMVARSVWNRGGQHRNQLFQGRSQMSADALLARAVERRWLSVSSDGIVAPGTVNPVQVMPVVQRSRSERVMAWGPGPDRDW